MLRACRRILRPGGRTAFLVIEPTPGLDARQRRRASRIGPFAVAVRTSYTSMLSTAGFVDIGRRDLTTAYRRTQQDWIDAYLRRRSALTEVLGREGFDERHRERQATVRGIDEGLLSRCLYTAARPAA